MRRVGGILLVVVPSLKPHRALLSSLWRCVCVCVCVYVWALPFHKGRERRDVQGNEGNFFDRLHSLFCLQCQNACVWGASIIFLVATRNKPKNCMDLTYDVSHEHALVEFLFAMTAFERSLLQGHGPCCRGMAPVRAWRMQSMHVCGHACKWRSAL
jgi:hypothetical protein